MKNSSQIIHRIVILTAIVLGAFTLSVAGQGVWTAPTALPTGKNIETPINVSGTQSIKGSLKLADFSLIPPIGTNLNSASIIRAGDGTGNAAGILEWAALSDIDDRPVSYDDPFCVTVEATTLVRKVPVYLVKETIKGPINFCSGSAGCEIRAWTRESKLNGAFLGLRSNGYYRELPNHDFVFDSVEGSEIRRTVDFKANHNDGLTRALFKRVNGTYFCRLYDEDTTVTLPTSDSDPRNYFILHNETSATAGRICGVKICEAI